MSIDVFVACTRKPHARVTCTHTHKQQDYAHLHFGLCQQPQHLNFTTYASTPQRDATYTLLRVAHTHTQTLFAFLSKKKMLILTHSRTHPRYTKLGFAGNTEPQYIFPSSEPPPRPHPPKLRFTASVTLMKHARHPASVCLRDLVILLLACGEVVCFRD